MDWDLNQRKKIYYFFKLTFNIQGGPKVTHPKEKLNISITVQANELIFLLMIEAYWSFIFIKTSIWRLFVKYYEWSPQKNITFSQIGKKQHTEWRKSHLIDKKIEYLHYSSSKRTDFFVDDRGILKFYIYKYIPRETLC